MNKQIKKLLHRWLWWLIAFHKLVLRRKSYLHQTGWIESLKHKYPCGKDGAEIPWMNYSVIHLLRERLHKDLSLFEYGSGYSTLFYARLVRDVISIEYDRDWFDLIEKRAPGNVSFVYKEKDIDGGYCRAIGEFEKTFDVVIVDGRDRVNCVKQAIKELSEIGVIILDDSSRERYSEAVDYAENRGFRALSIEGLKPTGYGTDRTTILYRDNNCLNI